MAENKTRPTGASVEAYIATVADEERRRDCEILASLMTRVTGEPAAMWGDSIVGFGSYHYRYESGREGDAPLVGFSPRKGDISLYVLAGYEGEAAFLARVGRHKGGEACPGWPMPILPCWNNWWQRRLKPCGGGTANRPDQPRYPLIFFTPGRIFVGWALRAHAVTCISFSCWLGIVAR